MTKFEFWCRLRELERKYDKKTHSPVRFRLRRIDEWASLIMEGWSPTEGVPRWLCNELKYVEEGSGVWRKGGGYPRELPPVYADLLFHGVLNDQPWWTGNVVLPSTFIMGRKG